MSLWSRLANVFRSGRLTREIDEELQSHLDDAVEHGRDPSEARRAFGNALHHRENARDVQLFAWLDSLRADIFFAWRQLRKNKVASSAAILSLGLAIGACTAAFRLIDALLLRPLPVAHPERLYSLYHESKDIDGSPRMILSYEYPLFRRMRAAVKEQAQLIGVSYAYPVDITFGSNQEMEKARLQYVSGWMFDSFGLRPAAGRLLTENDDLTPAAHPYAVLSYDYWTRRFGQDPSTVGRTFRMGQTVFTVVGVAEKQFTGTEPGTYTGIFIPTMMHPAVTRNAGWLRAFVQLKPGSSAEAVRDRLRVPFREMREQWARGFVGRTKADIERFLSEILRLESASTGVSGLQRDYRRPLLTLGVLVALVLLVACANVANLMTAQAAARARELALRVSIGAGRSRLVQLVLVESAWLAGLASAAGWAFAWWSAPFLAGRIDYFGSPARLTMPIDWRVLGFALAIALVVTLLFGLAPALRAGSVRPAAILKGGEPHTRRRLMHALIAVQAAFCFFVLFVGGLFIASYDKLSNQPTGFSAERILLLNTVTERAQSPFPWDQAAQHVRSVPGVESVALAGFPLLSGSANVGSISVDGGSPQRNRAYFLNVSPGWIGAMKIPLHAGRDFSPADAYPGVAIVNEAFVKQYFHGGNPIGKVFEKTEDRVRFQVIGIAGDARYRDLRGPMMPVAYVPFQPIARDAAIVVRTAGNPLALAPTLRREISRAWPEFVVSEITTQEQLVRQHTVRERLLAMLALCFAAVALLLAAIGLYGVLDYSVLQRRREFGIRMAVGAPAGDIARRVAREGFIMILAGASGGLGLGMIAVRYIESLLFQVKSTDLAVLIVPFVVILTAASLAALPAVIRAVRIDPVQMLRSE
jgi:predicted permease